MIAWLQSWLPWFGGGLGAGLAAAWFFGLMPVIGAAAQVVAAVLAPVLGAVVSGIVWVWQNILWPGLRDILEDWVTIVTVVILAVVGWAYMESSAAIQRHALRKETTELRLQLKKVSAELRQAKVALKKTGASWPF